MISPLTSTDTPQQEEYRGKFLRLIKEGTWEYVERVNAQGAVMIAAVTEQEELIVIEEYRVPLHAYTLALPAGISGDEGEESFLHSAQRELLEETGYISSDWEYLCEGPSSPGLTTEMVVFFLARNAQQVEAGGGLESEDITVHKIPLKDIAS